MIEFTLSDIKTNEQLKHLGITPKEITRYRLEANLYGELIMKLKAANDNKDWTEVLELEQRIDQLTKHLKYLGQHPKTIPIKELQELPRNAGESTTENNYRDRITNPATAIRGFCVMCMGGNIAYVRECQAVSCTLWPFRTGKNPLHGKTLPPVDFDMDIDPAEQEDEPEDESDNQDADL